MTSGVEAFGRALDGFENVLREFGDPEWGSLSPCDPWTALDVAGHVIGGLRWAAGLVEGSDALDAIRTEGFSNPSAFAVPAPLTAFVSARSQLDEAVGLAGSEKVLSWPFGERSVDTGLEWFSLEVLVHTWDLAGAKGSEVRLDPLLVHQHLVRLRPLSSYLRGPGMYGPELEAPAGADEQEQFLAFLGRRSVTTDA